MRVHLLTLRFSPSIGGFDDRPLTDFVRDKELLSIREHFFLVHEVPHLACVLTYQAPPVPTRPAIAPPRSPLPVSRPAPAPPREERFDIAPEDLALFETMRDWRSERAKAESVPAFVILNNRELAAIVAAKPRTLSALGSIEGVGPAKTERYGAAILAKLHGSPPADAQSTQSPA
ncbi:MAG: HRDC domain-containing protein [Planctomycetes bacterium]|nr:HRDC domain-containing protein [Planctomycetota bacterium]